MARSTPCINIPPDRRTPSGSVSGILTVVDPTTDPVELYESLLALRPPALDLLLPHGNWSAPPPHREGPELPTATGCGAVFDRSWQAGRREIAGTALRGVRRAAPRAARRHRVPRLRA